MRPIKFRAWHNQEKRMIYPSSVRNWMLSFDGGVFFRLVNIHDCSDSVTLMQFTGLLDKNGNEIWEGDIVEHFKENFEVRWSSIHAHFFGHRLDSHGTSFFRIGSDLKDAEVLGNIYENGDLLK